MSDLLQAASEALDTPPELVRRSAAARAEANGTSIDEILAAWSGGEPVSAPAADESQTDDTPADDAPVSTEAAAPAPEPEPAPVLVMAAEPQPVPTPALPAAETAPLDPVPLRTRVKTAVRIGAWTGAALGVLGFLAASAFWAPLATVAPETGPVIQVSPSSLMIGLALVSVVFGAVVAGMSRAATGWTNPAMELSGSKSATLWLGAGAGLVLGLIAGAVLAGLGTPVEASDPVVTQLPVLSTLLVMVIGGAILGGVTALVPQILGVPVAVGEPEEEVVVVKRRLSNAMGIPLVGLLILAVLVLPFAYALIESNHLAPGSGGAIVAILAASGILGFAALAGNRPEMRISMGDVMVAVIGIGVILVIVISVLFYTGGEAEHDEEHAGEAAIVTVLS